MGKKRLFQDPQIVAAIISVMGTIIGTLLVSVLLGFLEGRLGLGPVVAVITLLLVLSIWGLLAFRWGVRLAGAAAAAMVIVGSVVFLIITAGRIISIPGPIDDTRVAEAESPMPEMISTQTPTAAPSPAEEPRAVVAGECRIAYEQDGDIYVKNCDGSGVYQVTNHPAMDGSPAWSPDGQRIVFHSERDREPWPEGWTPASLYIVNADGSNLTRLTHTDDNDHWASWSPDGSRIAFHRNCTLTVVNPDGSNPVTLVEKEKEGLCVECPVWSPDGQRLAFVSGPPGAEAGDDLAGWVVKADGTGLVKLDEFYGRYAIPVWSPDGSQVAVQVRKPEGDEYYRTMNADGSGEAVEVESIPDSWYPWHWPQWGGTDPRKFVERILVAIADRPPDFSDDFSDAASGWDVGVGGEGERGYANGEYFILALPADVKAGTVNCNSGETYRMPEFSDFVLEIDGRFVSGSNQGDWQVHLRNGPEGFYAVHLALDGRLNVSTVRDKEMLGLVDLHGPPIQQGLQANRLQIIAKGPEIAVGVNGEPLALVWDKSFSRGTILLVVCNGDETPLEVRFDKLKVWDISDLPE